jgi:hypothetical protein
VEEASETAKLLRVQLKQASLFNSLIGLGIHCRVIPSYPKQLSTRPTHLVLSAMCHVYGLNQPRCNTFNVILFSSKGDTGG